MIPIKNTGTCRHARTFFCMGETSFCFCTGLTESKISEEGSQRLVLCEWLLWGHAWQNHFLRKECSDAGKQSESNIQPDLATKLTEHKTHGHPET